MYVHTFLVLNANEFGLEKMEVGGVLKTLFSLYREHHGYWIHNRLYVVNDLALKGK